ncbi:MAG: hypothetical protein EPN60_07230 [Nevskiaceae bacterium]|jgi:hypothetical protein|nr:MAG: hypothetical protein EPO48_10380 [Nevskiaceae bacterium]TAM28374.1 MAG: hypothetical protein EPN60_07230 [Nevskiaceae bacterium]
MRKTVQTLALLASGVGVVFAAAPRGEAPEARAYLSIGYGQAKQVPSQFFYGLRLDHDSRSELRGAAPIAQLSFDRDGFESARLNGLPFTRRLSANQDEGSGGSEGGMFSNYSALDWTLLAVGAVGIGFAVSQVADSEDTPDPAPGSSSGGSSAGGSSGGSSSSGGSGSSGGGLLGGYADPHAAGDDRRSAEYADWLDGGTGQMGDLAPR